MPTKFTLHKWLCDHCTQLCDTDVDCFVHERVAHKQAPDTTDLLNQMCVRIETEEDPTILAAYKRVCVGILTKLADHPMMLNAETQNEEEESPENSTQRQITSVKRDEQDADDREFVLPPALNPMKKPYYCDVADCTKVVYNKNTLRYHKLTVHEKLRKHRCDQCSNAYFTATHLVNTYTPDR
jgi:hypothetical protein